jgi:hypothetical protein
MIRLPTSRLGTLRWLLSGMAILLTVAQPFVPDAVVLVGLGSGGLALLALLIEHRLARRESVDCWPATLSRNQRKALRTALSGDECGVLTIAYVRGNSAAKTFAEHLQAVLNEAGWMVSSDVLFWETDFVGLELRTNPALPLPVGLSTLRRELTLLGFTMHERPTDDPSTVGRLLVGSSPR